MNLWLRATIISGSLLVATGILGIIGIYLWEIGYKVQITGWAFPVTVFSVIIFGIATIIFGTAFYVHPYDE